MRGFGARAQKEMGTFSDIALEQMLRQDIAAGKRMQTLAEQIKSCSFTAQAKGLSAGCSAARRRWPKCRPHMKKPFPESTRAQMK